MKELVASRKNAAKLIERKQTIAVAIRPADDSAALPVPGASAYLSVAG
jgi:hypothetical protein